MSVTQAEQFILAIDPMPYQRSTPEERVERVHGDILQTGPEFFKPVHMNEVLLLAMRGIKGYLELQADAVSKVSVTYLNEIGPRLDMKHFMLLATRATVEANKMKTFGEAPRPLPGTNQAKSAEAFENIRHISIHTPPGTPETRYVGQIGSVVTSFLEHTLAKPVQLTRMSGTHDI